LQAIWTTILCVSGSYGQLLDYIIFAVLVFYILTILGLFVLRVKAAGCAPALQSLRLSVPAGDLHPDGDRHLRRTAALQAAVHLAGPDPGAAGSSGSAMAGVDPSTLPQKHGVFNLVAFIGIMLVTTILVIGIKESANFNSIIVAVKLVVLFIFIGIGGYTLMHHPQMVKANWHPFLPPNTGSFGSFGWSGALRGAGVIFFAYIGFDAVSTAAQEAKKPKTDMPMGILGSLAICTVLYILVALVLTGLVNYKYLNVPDSLAVGMEMTGVKWGSLLVKIGALGGLTSTMIVMLLGQSRVFFSMSKDGLLPKFFSSVHPKFRTPWISSITVGLVVATFASLIPLASLGEMTSIGTLLAFIIVCAGVWVLRKRSPELPRPFRAPWMPFTPIAGIVVSLAMMLGLPLATWIRLVVWLAVGMVIYFTYSRRHSKCTSLL
jgi:APA family basic amino acid/polyamine antiporter